MRASDVKFLMIHKVSPFICRPSNLFIITALGNYVEVFSTNRFRVELCNLAIKAPDTSKTLPQTETRETFSKKTFMNDFLAHWHYAISLKFRFTALIFKPLVPSNASCSFCTIFYLIIKLQPMCCVIIVISEVINYASFSRRSVSDPN